jgi:ABC-type multidrug transport system fused ATPase/permease subunit
MDIIIKLSELLAVKWIELYKKWPKTTKIVSAVAVIIIIPIFVISLQYSNEVEQAKRLQNSTYTKQIQSLSETHDKLRSLIDFVDNEKRQIEVSQKILQSLKSEHDKLKPIVESDRKTIESILAAQDARNQIAQSWERWIGFFLGILASLVASFVYGFITYIVHKKKSDLIS